jgi:hypothetical protein
MNKTWIIIFIIFVLTGIVLTVLFLTRKKSCGTCSGHGTCDTKSGKCNCDPKYSGSNCDTSDSDITTIKCDCSGKGNCGETGKCKCYPNYLCQNGGMCNKDGSCNCLGFWTGEKCEEKIYVAVGIPEDPKDAIVWSVDGKTDWKGVGPNGKTGWILSGVTWNGKIFVAVGYNRDNIDETILYSEENDINKWTGVGEKIFKVGHGITWNGTIFVAVGVGLDITKSISWSADGKTGWTGCNTIFQSVINGITWSDTEKIFVAVGDSDGTNNFPIAYSKTGKSDWNIVAGLDNYNFHSVANNKNGFVAVGTNLKTIDGSIAGSIAYSKNGQSDWTIKDIFEKPASEQDSSPVGGYGVACSESIFVAVGYGVDKIFWTDDNGENWNKSENGNDTFSNNNNGIGYGSGITWTGKIFIAVGTGQCSTAWSVDGKYWIQSDTNYRNLYNGVV